MDFRSISAEQTKELASQIASKVKAGDIILLYGDLGAGKTTFTGFFVKALGIDARVQSPTFVLHRIYQGGSGEIKTVHHLDLYRLTDSNQFEDLNLQEILNQPESICIVEWPNNFETYWPENSIRIRIQQIEEERIINVENLY